jgi:hypothetical protein
VTFARGTRSKAMGVSTLAPLAAALLAAMATVALAGAG